MDITIAICSWNRAELLRGALQSLSAALACARSEVEVLVVNNNSTDHTDEVIADTRLQVPLRRVFESRPGLSHARNAAVKAAKGEYILWIDDDVLVEPGWLLAYEQAIDANPGATFFGGPIRPHLIGKPPTWLSGAGSCIYHIYSAIDLGAESFEVKLVRHLPYGANYAIRLKDQLEVEYSAELGRQPDGLWLGGEESAVLKTLLQRGSTGWWLPEAGVSHMITPQRQTLRYLVAHGLGQGRTYMRLDRTPQGGAKLLGRSISLWRSCFKELRECLLCTLGGKSSEWVPQLHRACVVTGRLLGP